MEAILNSSFDWNGIRAPYVFATENDSLNGASMLLSYLLTNTAQIFADVRTYWSPDAVRRVTGQALEGRAAGGVIHLINSGSATLDASGQMERDGQPAMKPFWEIKEGEITLALEATTWYPAVTGYFRGGGFSSNFVSKGGMPVTMCRINLVAGVGPVLQLAQGWTVDLPPDVHRALDQRTNPTWPTHWFVPDVTGDGPFRDVYSVMANWGANHGAISYGHVGADLITLASLLRIPARAPTSGRYMAGDCPADRGGLRAPIDIGPARKGCRWRARALQISASGPAGPPDTSSARRVRTIVSRRHSANSMS